MGVVGRTVLFAAVLGVCAAAQDVSTYTSSSVDINGHRVTGPEVVTKQSKTGSETTELTRSINGRMVPLERVEEKVVRDDPSGKVVERTIQRYDLTGNPLPPKKVVIEETKGSGGSSTILETTYSRDINGRMQVTERSTTQKQVSGSSETADTVVERPTINGALETVEKQATTTVKQANGYEEAAITYRKGPEGFYAAARRVTDHTQNGNQSTDNIAEYEVGATGQLELHGQSVRNTSKRQNGAEDVEVDLFSKNVPGVVNDRGGLRLKEHQTIERRPTSSGTVVETVNVQRPTVSDPSRLGPPVQLSETVCRGKCDSRP